MTGLCLRPQVLRFVDVVTSSHNHLDHLDAATLKPLINGRPHVKFVIPEANRSFVAAQLGCPIEFPIGLDDGKTQTFDPWEFHAISAKHTEFETDAEGHHKFLSYVVRFGDFCVYHSGDTLVYPSLAEKLKPFHVDVAFLPINGNSPEFGIAGNMNGIEAAELAKEIEAKMVIPHHFEMFEFNTASPKEFIARCEQLGQNFRVLQCGERFQFER